MTDPMPSDLREKFHEVVENHLPHWRGAPPEPRVMLDRTDFSISAICDLVDNPNFQSEDMPQNLVALIGVETDAAYPPLTDHSYQGGARHVRSIIERRQAAFNATTSAGRN
jgi:hypothetical protein